MGDPGFKVVIKTIRKSVRHEKIEKDEVRTSVNYLWDKWSKGGRLNLIRMGIALIRDPAAFLSVPVLIMVLAQNMTPEILFGLYESFKNHGLFGEEDLDQKIPNVLSSLGTGGKEIPTINVSTASAIIAASAGGKILRSGTRSFFSNSGATDFLNAFDIPSIADLALVEPIIRKTGLALIDGEVFNPGSSQIINSILSASKNIKTLAKTLSYPLRHAVTLLKPAGSVYAYRGISLPITRQVAEALRSYKGFKRGFVVFSRDTYGRSFDELSNFGPNQISEFNGTNTATYTLWSHQVGIQLRNVKEIEITNPHDGYAITLAVFQGKRAVGDSFAELLALNAGGMLYASGFVTSIAEGIERSLEAIRKGFPYSLLKQYKRTLEELVPKSISSSPTNRRRYNKNL